MATAQSKMPPPAMKPSSAMPVKSVVPAAKKATAVVIAPVAIGGPIVRIVVSSASCGVRTFSRSFK